METLYFRSWVKDNLEWITLMTSRVNRTWTNLRVVEATPGKFRILVSTTDSQGNAIDNTVLLPYTLLSPEVVTAKMVEEFLFRSSLSI